MIKKFRYFSIKFLEVHCFHKNRLYTFCIIKPAEQRRYSQFHLPLYFDLPGQNPLLYLSRNGVQVTFNLFPPWCFGFVFSLVGLAATLAASDGNRKAGRMLNTWNLAQVLCSFYSLKESKKQYIAFTIFTGISIFNKNTVFYFFYFVAVTIFFYVFSLSPVKANPNSL